MNIKIIALMWFALLAGCSTQNPYLNVNGAYWRTTEAFSAPIYSVGVINTQSKNKFDPKSRLIITDFPLVLSTSLYSEETRKAAINAKAAAKKAGKIEISTESDKYLTGTYLIYRNTDTYGLIKKINSPENTETLASLKNEHETQVIITGVAIVYNNDRTDKIKVNADITGTITIPKVLADEQAEVKATVSLDKALHTNLSDGTVFAYEYSIIYWDDAAKDLKVKALTVDRPNKFVVWWFSI